MAYKNKQNLAITKEDFLKQCSEPTSKVGQPSKYREEYIELLYEVFANYGGRQEFEGIVDVSESTFQNWLKVYPNFKKAYKKVKALSYAQWEKLPLIEKDLNIVYWTAIMRNRFNFGKPRIKKADGKRPLEMVDSALESLQEGGMSIKEVSGVTDIASKRIEMEHQIKELVSKDGHTSVYDKFAQEDIIAIKNITDKYKDESK